MEKFRLLIIDDDENFQALLGFMLEEVERSEYDLHFCYDYKSGLTSLYEEEWDACLLDYRLETGSGLELLNSLKPNPVNFPIILMTGQNGGDIDIKALDAGASDYLSKDHLTGELIDRCLRYAIKTKKSESTLQRIAMTDALTGLANRARFKKALIEYKARADRNNYQIGLFFIDVDHFKQINDSIGHQGGDNVLKNVAEHLINSSRKTDLVARLGGDEFAIILDNLRDAADAARIANKIIEKCSVPQQMNLKEITARTSIGIAIYPKDSTDIDGLVNAADTAMYETKRSGRNGYRFFSNELHKKAKQVARIEHNLSGALDRGEFEVFYQPKIASSSRDSIGAEALIRWRVGQSEMVSPDLFIPIAEQAGMISDIGKWVMRQVCTDAINHADVSNLYECDSIAVNVSPRQLTVGNFAEVIQSILDETGYPASCLEIEITETALASDGERVMRQLNAIHEMGIRIAIDDFGTGYSSLMNLVEMPIDTLKIDRSFVMRCLQSRRHRKIVESVCSLAHGLELTIVAEGVEDVRVANYLEKLGCDVMQGYYFSRPISNREYFDNFYHHNTKKIAV